MLLLEQLERQVLADRQGLIARGAGGDLPSVQEERASFYERLSAEPTSTGASRLSADELELRRALKVA